VATIAGSGGVVITAGEVGNNIINPQVKDEKPSKPDREIRSSNGPCIFGLVDT
jgi:hypothetical protein